MAGEPFVGPAGKLFDEALVAAGIDRRTTYVTNTVKHFKWKPQGKVRLHQKPNQAEIHACRPWLESELLRINPVIVVCLGATAAQALIGPKFRVTKDHGRFIVGGHDWRYLATVHPSSILRARSEADRQVAYAQFVEDLRVVAAELT